VGLIVFPGRDRKQVVLNARCESIGGGANAKQLS
jgi:hypothetical protein